MTHDELVQIVSSHRSAIEEMCRHGGIAVVVRGPTRSAKALVESWGWQGEAVFRLPAHARRWLARAPSPKARQLVRKPPSGVLRMVIFKGENYWPVATENEAAADDDLLEELKRLGRKKDAIVGRRSSDGG